MGDVISFEYAPVLDAASLSKASCRIVEGPVNSGKSVWSASEVYKEMCTIPRGKDGLRHSKFIVVRDTYPNLKGSTIKTWLQWFPEHIYGKMTGSEPVIHTIEFLDVRCIVEFRAFDFNNPEKAIKDLKSTEWTGAWGNEIQFMPLSIAKELYSRTGRYPAKKDCPAYNREKWMVGDMNAPATHQYWGYYMRGKTPIPLDWTDEQKFEMQCPDDWEFFEQPAAVIEIRDDANRFVEFQVNPEAENLPHIGEKGVRQELSGRTYNDVRRDLMNKVVPMRKGFPRYTQFLRGVHVVDRIDAFDHLPMIAGYDPGVHGCIHLLQQWEDRWQALYTIQSNGLGVSNLADKVLAILNSRFAFWKETGFVGWGDPYGQTRFGAQGGEGMVRQEDTAFDIMGAKGLKFRTPGGKDDPSLRREATISLLKGRTDTGAPRLIVDKQNCGPLIMALDGGCTMKSQKTPDGMRVEEVVDKKNSLADVMEAAEYAFLGGGEGEGIVRPKNQTKPKPKSYTGNSTVWRSRSKRRA